MCTHASRTSVSLCVRQCVSTLLWWTNPPISIFEVYMIAVLRVDLHAPDVISQPCIQVVRWCWGRGTFQKFVKLSFSEQKWHEEDLKLIYMVFLVRLFSIFILFKKKNMFKGSKMMQWAACFKSWITSVKNTARWPVVKWATLPHLKHQRIYL